MNASLVISDINSIDVLGLWTVFIISALTVAVFFIFPLVKNVTDFQQVAENVNNKSILGVIFINFFLFIILSYGLVILIVFISTLTSFTGGIRADKALLSFFMTMQNLKMDNLDGFVALYINTINNIDEFSASSVLAEKVYVLFLLAWLQFISKILFTYLSIVIFFSIMILNIKYCYAQVEKINFACGLKVLFVSLFAFIYSTSHIEIANSTITTLASFTLDESVINSFSAFSFRDFGIFNDFLKR